MPQSITNALGDTQLIDNSLLHAEDLENALSCSKEEAFIIYPLIMSCEKLAVK